MERQVKQRGLSEKPFTLRSRVEPVGSVAPVRLRMRPTDGGSGRACPG